VAAPVRAFMVLARGFGSICWPIVSGPTFSDWPAAASSRFGASCAPFPLECGVLGRSPAVTSTERVRDYQTEDGFPGEFKTLLEGRLAEVRRRLERLQQRLRDRCPGPHEYTPHRAGEFPWCEDCGFTDTGLHRSEIGANVKRWSGRDDHSSDYEAEDHEPA
jgi:hypothetical protein